MVGSDRHPQGVELRRSGLLLSFRWLEKWWKGRRIEPVLPLTDEPKGQKQASSLIFRQPLDQHCFAGRDYDASALRLVMYRQKVLLLITRIQPRARLDANLVEQICSHVMPRVGVEGQRLSPSPPLQFH